MTDMIDFRRSAWGGFALATGLLLASPALAQSGSVGGSIGKEDKSISGSQAPAARSVPPSAPAQSAPRQRSSNRSNSGGGGGGGGGGGANPYDGVWTFVGVSSGNCSGSVTLTISGGRLVGEGYTGTVSPNGAINVVGANNGISAVSTGKLSGKSGSGSYQQSDGCTSRWVASKQ
jgi:hypothetical protein